MIGAVRESMCRVFGELLLEDISDPLTGGTFCFTKGTAKSYHYKNLSGGEKSAFNLIFDLHIKKEHYPEAIYCIDEVETHLHTSVQGALTKELVNIIPDEGQLWLSTHSLGVLRACQEIEKAHPGSVAVIDFDGINPDEPTELTPVSLGRVTWDKFMSIALGDLSSQLAPKVIILCEGSPEGKGSRKNFDAEIYNRIFNSNIAEVLFVSAGSASEVEKAKGHVEPILRQSVPETHLIPLIDRDDRTEAE